MNTIPYKVAKIGGGKLFIMPKPIAGEYVGEEFQSLSQQVINLEHMQIIFSDDFT